MVQRCADCQTAIEAPESWRLDTHLQPRPLCPACTSRHREQPDSTSFCTPLAGVEPDPQYEPECLSALSDEELLRKVKDAFEATVYVDEDRKISCVQDLKTWCNFATAWNTAASRGYPRSDLSAALRSLAISSGSLQAFKRKLGKPADADPEFSSPTWQEFEQLVAKFHAMKSDRCTVTVDEKVPDRTTGTPRQLDVTLRFTESFYRFLVVIECRDQKAHVTIGDVEEFARKVEDVRANKGVMVARCGFDSGAIAKAAFYAIDLYTLSQACQLDWKEYVRKVTRVFPFPRELTFTPVEPGSRGATLPGRLEASYEDFRLLDAGGHEVEQLLHLLWRLSNMLLKEAIPLPAEVRVHFDPPVVVRLDRLNLSTPMREIAALFVLATATEDRILHRPDLTYRYDYRHVGTGEVHSFPVPKG